MLVFQNKIYNFILVFLKKSSFVFCFYNLKFINHLFLYFLPLDQFSMDATISRMTALDGVPFSFFTTSEDMRECLAAKGTYI